RPPPRRQDFFQGTCVCAPCELLNMELRKSLRRKFSGNIRSPVVRRDNQAEVVIKGWLYKLEGATIKQWKKRWCILSDYCLFYYKGSEEEKCLGSILLPSYKIRPCTADDKVSLKHSFVAEHQNTKTYYFAADNNTSMCQWMNAMSLAALMQKDTERSRQALPPPHGPQSAVGGAQGFLPADYQFPQHVGPQRHGLQHHAQRPSDESFEVEAYSAGAVADGHYLGSGDQYPCSYTRSPIYDQRPAPPAAPRQRPCHPVYANAPPKPLRHGATSPNAGDSCSGGGGAYDGYNSYEGYDFYGAQEPLPAYAGRPVSAHYGDSLANSVTTHQLMRPRSADFLERDDNCGADDDGELYFRKRSAPAIATKPRPKSSMAHYDWEDEEEAREWRGHQQQQQQQQWRSRTMETVTQSNAFHDQPQFGAATSPAKIAGAGGSPGSAVQSKKAAHKEQSMKRLLEWKQRMLQSPLCKKPGQQQQQQQQHRHTVPSPHELQSAVLRKTPVPSNSSSSLPPERPPLPEEYRRRASEGSRPTDSSPGGQFFATEALRGTPVGRAQETFAPPGPDLIRKRCWSNDFQKSSAQGDLYRHSVDNLYARGTEIQPKNSLARGTTEPAHPSSVVSLSHSISAGDLLGKSHEELVLLLIQLRRSQSNLLSCQLQCKEEMHELKQSLVQSGTQSSAADVQRLVGLQRSLNELTRNLDLTQPLISLVENMVKLGSLYNVAGMSKQTKKTDEGEDYRYEDTYADTLEAETLEKQQQLVEKEILHIQKMLAESTSCGSPLKDDLEVELKRLQKIVNDMLQRKSKMSTSPNIYLDKEPEMKAKPSEPKLSPPASVPERKRHQKTYYETDLDSSVTSNLALDSRPVSLCDVVSASQIADLESPSFSPEPNEMAEDRSSYLTQDISKADDRTKKFYGLLPRDRAQEIKTVRIVKRESERRNKGKDRRKGGLDDSVFPWVVEEGDAVFCNEEEEENESRTAPADTAGSTYESPFETKKPPQDSTSSSEDRSTSSSSSDSTSCGQRTPVKNESRRNKRRHYTISGSHPFLEQHSPPKMAACLRSRDDMDMERCLRTVNTPDIVRSTIKKSDVYDEQTIDMQIGLPQKILIPERYIEVESENVSAVEQLRRSLKAANIRKMLTETVGYEDLGAPRGSVEALRSKVGEEKRRRAHLLALSHTIAKEVMERSKMVAAHVTYQENT
ncbi:hypothetical protein V5799_004278, partial [Amblyomma americanum]